MLRTLLTAIACVPVLLVGTVAAQGFTGTFTIRNQTGGAVTLVLAQDARGRITGTLTGNGNTFQIQGQVDGEDFVALASGAAGGAYLEGTLEGGNLHVILAELGPDNQPRYDQARELMFVRQSSGGASALGAFPPVAPPAPAPTPAPAPPAPGAANAPAPAMSPYDQQLSQLLLSSKWCHFSYSGVAGSSSGSSSTETVFFSPDGLMVVQTGGESYYSADVRTSTGDVIARGSAAGQRGGGQQYRWRVQQGMLMVSTDGVTWQPLQIQVTRNSNGYPIVTADGKEYSQCS